MPNSGFLAGIEGMRALAVLAVLLFHLDLSGVAGGYLGVDLFFVISGFIITRNILLEQGRGTFTLRDFYIRRLRRLFPALAVTVLLTLLAALPLVPAQELALLGRSAIFALFSLANFNFWLEAGYFDAAAHTKPLLHMWSLSVEEQFYLFWPTLLVLLGAVGRAPAALLLLLASGAAVLLWRVDAPDAVFYLLPFRVHQLMVGALVAILALRFGGLAGSLAAGLGTIGFLVLVTWLGDACSPATGALAVSALGFLLLMGRESRLALAFYGLPFMQWVGRRSYALYLVHWPVVVLYLYARGFEQQPHELLALFPVFFVLAAVLHVAVEQPFRLRGGTAEGANPRAVPITLGVLLVSCMIAGTYWQTGGRLLSTANPYQALIDSVEDEKALRLKAIRNNRCNLHPGRAINLYRARECATVEPDRTNVLVIGDSRAADLYMLLSRTYPAMHFLQATGAACPALLEYFEGEAGSTRCRALNELRFGDLLAREIDAVVLATAGQPKRLPYLKNTLEYLHARGKPVIVFGPRATFPAAVPLLLARERDAPDVNAVLAGRMRRPESVIAMTRDAAAGAPFVDLAAVQCSPACDAFLDGRLLYYDNFHFTTAGADEFGRRLREQVDFPALVAGAAVTARGTR